jgi:hypothetical protein
MYPILRPTCIHHNSAWRLGPPEARGYAGALRDPRTAPAGLPLPLAVRGSLRARFAPADSTPDHAADAALRFFQDGAVTAGATRAPCATPAPRPAELPFPVAVRGSLRSRKPPSGGARPTRRSQPSWRPSGSL